ncbi:YkvA family protein [Variovorax paradoxus]
MALWVAGFHRETPRSAKTIAFFVVLYAALPVDLTPELLPLPSYLDDLAMLAELSWAAIHMVPANVWDTSCARGGSLAQTHDRVDPNQKRQRVAVHGSRSARPVVRVLVRTVKRCWLFVGRIDFAWLIRSAAQPARSIPATAPSPAEREHPVPAAAAAS